VPHASTGRPLTERERLRAIAATHTWVGAAELPLSPGQARTVDLRAAVTIKADTKVHVIDAYCSRCKRNYEAVEGVTCTAIDTRTNEHLRGGPIGERKKRGRQPRRDQEAV
jgi:hypothetical protein